MDRVYGGHRGGYTNPDYELDDRVQDKFQYQDDMKSGFGNPYTTQAQVFEDIDEEDDSPYTEGATHPTWLKLILHIVRLTLCISFFGLILAIPAIVENQFAYDVLGDDTEDNKNLTFWISIWLVSTYASGVAAFLLMSVFPYIFYIIAKYINPAHKRYWRVFRPLKWPFTSVITVLFSWIWMLVLIAPGTNIGFAYRQPTVGSDGTEVFDPTTQALANAVGTIADILQNAIFWAVGYMIVKIVIIYISVHYHYRSDHSRIERSKKAINALSTLYDASLAIDPLYCNKFHDQDIIIRDAVAVAGHRKRGALKFFQKIGGASHKVLSAFGNMLGSQEGSHWFKAGSTYAVVEHALEEPESAKALAQRIWLSLVPKGADALTKDHVKEVLSLDQKEDAEKAYDALDQDENGDIRLSELEPMLVEMGKTRFNIYRNMQEIDHCINTFEWIALCYLALFMLFIILFNYVPILSNLKEIMAGVGAGIGFTAGRVVAEFANGCIFVFFKHPYDIGDRIDIYNPTDLAPVSVTVKRISLLYCIFESTDTGATVQYANTHLLNKRIDNLTRSGNGTETLKVCLSINTSFKDLEHLQDQMSAFLKAPENCRDYKPKVALRVKSIHDLEKMEIAMVVTHKANWSNGLLKSARSSRLYCRMIELARTIPLVRPNGDIIPVGADARPQYMVVVSDEEAGTKVNANKSMNLRKRHDFQQIDSSGLDAAAKKAKDTELRAAEAAAYAKVSSIPATMAGRGAERPAHTPAMPSMIPQIQTVVVQEHQNRDEGSRDRVQGRSFSSTRQLVNMPYQSHPAALGIPSQTYDSRRGNGNGLQDGSRRNLI